MRYSQNVRPAFILIAAVVALGGVLGIFWLTNSVERDVEAAGRRGNVRFACEAAGGDAARCLRDHGVRP